MASKQKKRYFQYIDGENKGKVVMLTDIFESDGELFYEFDNKDTMNRQFISKMTAKKEQLAKKFMVEVSSPLKPDLWRFEEVKSTVVDMGNQERKTVPPLDDILAMDEANKNSADGTYAISSSLGKKKLRFPINTPTEFPELPGLDWFEEEDVPEQKKPQQSIPVNETPIEMEPYVEDGEIIDEVPEFLRKKNNQFNNKQPFSLFSRNNSHMTIRKEKQSEYWLSLQKNTIQKYQ